MHKIRKQITKTENCNKCPIYSPLTPDRPPFKGGPYVIQPIFLALSAERNDNQPHAKAMPQQRNRRYKRKERANEPQAQVMP